MPQPIVRISKPCSQSWATMTPTVDGRHCAACATEVVDFTRMNNEDILAYLATRPGQRVCGLIVAPLVEPRHYKRPTGARRWILAIATLFGWQVMASCKPPQLLPASSATMNDQAQQIVIRGQVLDDSLHQNVPLGGVYVFISGTEYGTVTDENGNFTLAFAADWLPIQAEVKAGTINLYVPHVSFATYDENVQVSMINTAVPQVLAIHLRSIPERGQVKGKTMGAPRPKPLSELFNKRR